MGFYYGSSQPPKDEKPGGWKETFLIIWVVFSVLALPLALILAGVVYLVVLFWLFIIHPLLGLAWLGVAAAAVVARGVWEAKHPPEIR